MTSTGNHNQGATAHAPATLPIPQSHALGTAHAVPISGPSRIHLRRVGGQADSVKEPSRFDRGAIAVAALLLAAAIAIALSSCIPVTIRPQFDAKGLPKAIPVTPVGSVSSSGELLPIYPVSNEAPTPTNWGAWGAAIGAITTALLAAYGINLRGFASKAQAALRIACDLADQNAKAETDTDVERNKMIASQQQMAAGVQALTQKVRGK